MLLLLCRNEISELLYFLGRSDDRIPPLLLYGAAATGKTSIVREAMRVLGRPHAYASCCSCHSPRLLFESILNQLWGHVRSAANRYSSGRRCERLIDFTKLLPAACLQAVSRHRSHRKHRSSSFKKVWHQGMLFILIMRKISLAFSSCRSNHVS